MSTSQLLNVAVPLVLLAMSVAGYFLTKRGAQKIDQRKHRRDGVLIGPIGHGVSSAEYSQAMQIQTTQVQARQREAKHAVPTSPVPTPPPK